MMERNVYLQAVLETVPRLLGLMDRSPASKSYGCCDRTYWHYRTVDFPSARYQEAALMLALLYTSRFEGNAYYHNARMLEWCRAAMLYWARMQEANGSFNEWYPHESSFVATAFSSYAVSESMLLLKDEFLSGHDVLLAALRKAGSWLAGRSEQRVTNQLSGAALALYNIALLTGDDSYRKNAEQKIKLILSLQTAEGWWKEYTGPDIGYLSLMASYLAKYAGKTGDAVVKGAVGRALTFLSYFLHPDLSAGGVYGCRNTAYVIPFGAEFLASDYSDAAAIAAHVRRSLDRRITLSPGSLDDRYLAYTGYEWLQAGLIASSLNARQPRFAATFEKDFPVGRLYVRSTPAFYLIINYGKGGAFFLSTRSGTSFSDGGVVASDHDASFSSGWVTAAHRVVRGEGRLTVAGPLYNIPALLPTFPKMAFLRLFQATIGRSALLGLRVKKMLRDRLITSAKPSPFAYRREFVIGDKTVEVRDAVEGGVLMLHAGILTSSIYVPSTNYFQPEQLSPAVSSEKSELARRFHADGKVEVL